MNQTEVDAIRVAVLDDHQIVLHGVQALAAAHPDQLVVVGIATTIRDLCALVASVPVDAVLFDLHLADGLAPTDTIRSLSAAGISVVVHTSELRPIPIRAALRAGARGVALKSDPPELVLEVLREVMRGQLGLTSDLAHVLASDPELVANLTKRELEALQLLSDGVPKQAIGRTMDPPVEQSTVNTYFLRVAQRYQALGRDVHNVYGALREATRDGYLDSWASPTDDDR